MKSLILLSLLSLILSSSGCDNISKSNFSINSFELSNDDSLILFSATDKNNLSSIYQISTDGKNVNKLISSSGDSSFFNPKYLPGNKKILFIGVSSKSRNSDIYIFDGSKPIKVTKGNEMISEAFFSKCDGRIYYVKSNEYGNSSPIDKSQFHGADIYSISLDGKNVKKVTQLNAYAMLDLSEYDCNHLLMYMPKKLKEECF
jgi:Tol biopolymer transport system component